MRSSRLSLDQCRSSTTITSGPLAGCQLDSCSPRGEQLGPVNWVPFAGAEGRCQQLRCPARSWVAASSQPRLRGLSRGVRVVVTGHRQQLVQQRAERQVGEALAIGEALGRDDLRVRMEVRQPLEEFFQEPRLACPGRGGDRDQERSSLFDGAIGCELELSDIIVTPEEGESCASLSFDGAFQMSGS